MQNQCLDGTWRATCPLATGLALLGETGLGSRVGSGHLSRSCRHGEAAEGYESEASPNRAVSSWATCELMSIQDVQLMLFW